MSGRLRGQPEVSKGDSQAQPEFSLAGASRRLARPAWRHRHAPAWISATGAQLLLRRDERHGRLIGAASLGAEEVGLRLLDAGARPDLRGLLGDAHPNGGKLY